MTYIRIRFETDSPYGDYVNGEEADLRGFCAIDNIPCAVITKDDGRFITAPLTHIHLARG